MLSVTGCLYLIILHWCTVYRLYPLDLTQAHWIMISVVEFHWWILDCKWCLLHKAIQYHTYHLKRWKRCCILQNVFHQLYQQYVLVWCYFYMLYNILVIHFPGKKTFGVPLGQPKLIVQRPFLQPKPVSQLSPTSSPRAGSSYKNNGKKKVYTCEICRRQFSHRASRSRHRKVHQKEASQGNLLRLLKKTPAYKCGICEKQFSQNSTLLQHRKFHGREKENFLCGVCEKQFDQAWSLIRHRKIHLSEKPYKCDVCGKCFIEKFNLKHHQYTHTGMCWTFHDVNLFTFVCAFSSWLSWKKIHCKS